MLTMKLPQLYQMLIEFESFVCCIFNDYFTAIYLVNEPEEIPFKYNTFGKVLTNSG